MSNNSERAAFSGKFGYVLATAGSAVGLGNIWRFPYLAAKYGGGMFLLTYIILAVTFGYAMMISETTLGRMTRKSPVSAFKQVGGGRFAGWLNAVIPMLIMPYYSVIGGWVMKYLYEYVAGHIHEVAGDSFFTDFIATNAQAPSVEFWFVLFALINFIIVVAGVDSGVERVSKIMMPALVILAICISIYSMTRPGALAGVKYFLVPDFKNFSVMTVVAALGQMFYSLSIAMGILVTYGSYMKKDVDIEKSTYQVQLFDTGIAILAGLMIIPSVFAFSGGDPKMLGAGPSLMFVTIPKVFESMGGGRFIGILFFVLVFFAAMTSSISLLETSVSTVQDELKMKRTPACIAMLVLMLVLGTLSALGYSVLGNIQFFGMAFLDFFDFLTNSLMMPLAAISICLVVVYRIGVRKIAEEVKISSKFANEKLYTVVIRWIAPVFLVVILVTSILSVLGIISI